MKKRRIVALEQIPENQQAKSCFYCYSPRSSRTGNIIGAEAIQASGKPSARRVRLDTHPAVALHKERFHESLAVLSTASSVYLD